MLNTQPKPATAHTTTGDDALIVSCLIALCSFGIFMLSDFDRQKPAGSVITAAIETTVPDALTESQPVAPPAQPSLPAPA
ncbi:hypothetical protein, partial [Hyphomonas sp.]|uniref:hypothetical protein n=1 Tax=Hyphomonas sp. TaxID=87 RepID=UPI0030FC904F